MTIDKLVSFLLGASPQTPTGSVSPPQTPYKRVLAAPWPVCCGLSLSTAALLSAAILLATSSDISSAARVRASLVLCTSVNQAREQRSFVLPARSAGLSSDQ